MLKIHEEYLENSPGVNWIKRGVLSHMDTWHADVGRPSLQHERQEVVGKEKIMITGNNTMIDQGMAYFVPYKSFTYLELLTTITLRHSP